MDTSLSFFVHMVMARTISKVEALSNPVEICFVFFFFHTTIQGCGGLGLGLGLGLRLEHCAKASTAQTKSTILLQTKEVEKLNIVLQMAQMSLE